MSFADVVGRFHVGLDGVGLLLQGAPDAPAYRVTNAPVYGTRFASGDRDYNDLSQWWYLIQTDWSGGIKETIPFEDDARFYYSTNIDARTSPGKIKLERGVASAYDNTANEVVTDVRDILFNEVTQTVFLENDNLRLLSDGSLVASGGSDDVNGYTSYLNYLWLFYNGALASGGIRNYDGSTESNKTSYINSLVTGDISKSFGGIVAAQTLFIFNENGAGNDYISIVKTTVADPASSADFTLVWEARFDAGSIVTGFAEIGGEIIFTLLTNNTLRLYSLDIASSIVSELIRFSSDNSLTTSRPKRNVQKMSNGKVIITVPYASTEAQGRIYEYDGSTLTKIFETNQDKQTLGAEAGTTLTHGCVVFGDYACWGNLVYDGVSFFNFLKDNSDSTTNAFLPIGYSEENNKLYFKIGTSGKVIYSYDLSQSPTSFKTGASNSAFLVFSNLDKLQSIDKLLNKVVIGFDAFLSGQEINIYYTTSSTPPVANASWTLLGSASFTLDGASATSKSFLFPEGVATKKVWFRVELVGGGSNTPAMTDFTLEYLPIPDYRFQWTLNLNCADEVKDLSGALVETTARELKARLMRAWMTKSALDYQDVDYASTQLNGALDSTTTTVTVDSTAFFPEQGRIKIDEEEIFYTGKTPSTFTGCTRGARGTRATTHADNAVVHNGYRVLAVDVDVRVPIIAEGKEMEYIVGLVLREV